MSAETAKPPLLQGLLTIMKGLLIALPPAEYAATRGVL